ncbi:hypothetical protein AeMF1_017614 [Aphanomyces euteiches]|nr:hypothetical protein AeMF1_017614 [Aphanomyces euteiches]KAH9196502.1 hypothetical protein AeNC1_001526 [Aphanomyces euteiches]
MARPTAGTILRMKKAAAKPKKKTLSLKNKIRNLERFLKKDSLPDDVRKAKEDELKELQQQSEDKKQEENSREITLKFKKVKFFDRRRLMRTLKKLKRQIESAEGKDKAKLEAEFESARKDMMYVYFYPKGEPYINLFPDAKKPHSKEDLTRQEALKRSAVEKFNALENHAAFEHYCFNDTDLPDEKPEKRRADEDKKHKRKEKRRKTAATVVADTELDKAESDKDDDFFL